MFVLCVVNTDKRQNAGQSVQRNKYDEVQSTGVYKKNPAWGMDVCVVLQVKTKGKTQDKEENETKKDEVESTREHTQKKFESRHERVVCCPVDVSATGRSFVQRSPTDCGVSK